MSNRLLLGFEQSSMIFEATDRRLCQEKNLDIILTYKNEILKGK